MNIPDSRSAARWADWTIEPGTKYKISVEPADPGPIHAWLHSASAGPNSQLERYILAQPGTTLLEDREYVEAACGTSLRVIYRRPFDMNQADVCTRCVEMVRLWQTDRDEYHRRVLERHVRWAERSRRSYEAFDAADWDRQESYGTDPIDTDDD